MKDYIEKQVSKNSERFKQTKTVRFFTHQKYRLYQLLATVALNVGSALLIALSVLSRFNLIEKSSPQIDILDFWILFCSVMMLVFGLILSSYDFREFSRMFFVSGNKINDLYTKLQVIEDKVKHDPKVDLQECEKEIKLIVEKYERLLKDGVNHSDYDFIITAYRNKKLFQKHIERFSRSSVAIAYIMYYLPFALIVFLIFAEILIPSLLVGNYFIYFQS